MSISSSTAKSIVRAIMNLYGYSSADEISHDDVYDYALEHNISDLTPASLGLPC